MVESKGAYIWQHVIPESKKNMIVRNLLNTGNKPSYAELVAEYEDQIPKHIKFVIVTLEPRWSTQV